MAMTANDSPRKFLNLAATHADDFKARVSQHDRENSFPFENVAAMKASGYLNMTLPAEFGGGGANLLDFVLAQERLARGDGPTAVAINMHIFLTGVHADLWRLGDESERPFIEAVARDSLVLCSGTSDPKINTMVGFADSMTRRAAPRKSTAAIASTGGRASAAYLWLRISSKRPPIMTIPLKDPCACCSLSPLTPLA